MERYIAIEPKLTPLKDYLVNKGYRVESRNFSRSTSLKTAGNYDAIILSGGQNSPKGLGNTANKAIIIEAKGLTPEEIAQELEIRLE